MQTIIVDLTKTPEIADAVADMEPGSEVCLHGTIKSLDDKTLVVTVEELSVPKEEDETKLPEGGNEGSDAAPAESPGGGASAMTDETAAV
jgi:hypothetical protein